MMNGYPAKSARPGSGRGASLLLCAALSMLAVPAFGVPSSSEIDVTLLGTLGGSSSVAWSLNNFGTVVGYSLDADGQWRAFRWTEEMGMVALPGLGGRTVALDVNNLGQVVGSSQDPLDVSHAVLWEADDTLVDLGTFEGDHAMAFAINDLGRVAANRITLGGHWMAVVWTADAQNEQIGTLGGQHSVATGINNAGEVVGYSATSNGEHAGFHFAFGTLTQLPDLGGGYSYAAEINQSGGIAGGGLDAEGVMRAIRWERTGERYQLVDPGLTAISAAAAINDDHDFVGPQAPAGTTEAFWRDTTGRTVSLPNLGEPYTDAEGISLLGDVCGWAKTPAGTLGATLWRARTTEETSCPEGGSCNSECLAAARCRVDCADTDRCKTQCAGSSACAVDCNRVSSCALECGGEGTLCALRCRHAKGCRAGCSDGATCTVDCHGANACPSSCSGAGTRCTILCGDGGSCIGTTCADGAECLIECNGAGGCGFATCDGPEESCPGGIVVCNRACPW